MPILGQLTAADVEQALTAYAVRNQMYVDAYVMRENILEKWFPFNKADEQQIEFWTGTGNAGVLGVDRDAKVPYTTTAIKRHQTDLLTDKFAYFLKNDLIERASMDFAAKYAFNANSFFGEGRTFKQVKALLAGAGQTVTSENTWNLVSPENSVTTALDLLTEYGWNSNRGPALCIFPARVGRGLYQQRFTGGSYQSILKVLRDGYREVGLNMEFIPYSPFYTSKKQRKMDIIAGTDSDALGTSAILAVGSPLVLQSVYYQYTKTPAQFVEQVSDEGFATILHRVQDARVVPMYEDETSSVFVVKIENVAPARAPA